MSWEKGNKTMFKGDQKPWDFFFGGGGVRNVIKKFNFLYVVYMHGGKYLHVHVRTFLSWSIDPQFSAFKL